MDNVISLKKRSEIVQKIRRLAIYVGCGIPANDNKPYSLTLNGSPVYNGTRTQCYEKLVHIFGSDQTVAELILMGIRVERVA